jgi:hypothetical protein
MGRAGAAPVVGTTLPLAASLAGDNVGSVGDVSFL